MSNNVEFSEKNEIIFHFEDKKEKINNDGLDLIIEEPAEIVNNFNNTQSRRWMLTINNPEETDDEMLKYIEELEHIKYARFQRERGEETGTYHFQMFLVFTIGKRFSTIKNLFPRAHIEKAKSSNIQCRDYCSKTDTRISGPYEIGEFAEERARTDLNGFIELIKSGATDREILDLYPTQFFKNYNMIERIRQVYINSCINDKIKENFICIYIYGASGIGKTSSLFNKYGNSKAYFIKDYNGHPFDNYKNQDIIVFDEYRGQLDFSLFLNLLDIYPMELSCRYNNKMGIYTKVFVISNLPFEKQYLWHKKNDYESYMGFPRRFHFILQFAKDVVYIEKATKPIEELKKLLPDKINNMLKMCITNSVGSEIVHQFTMIDDEELPF